MITRQIKLHLTEPQEDFIFSEAIHPAMVAGYGAGKSQAAVIRLALLALKYDGLSFGFVEPTYDLIRLIAFPRFQEILDEWGVKYNLNKADAIIKLENNSQIIFRSADNPERLVGFQLADAVIDEADTLRVDQAKLVWTKMLGRIRERKPDNSPNTLAAVSTGTVVSGATAVWHYGTLNSPITIGASASITPQFLANALVITET